MILHDRPDAAHPRHPRDAAPHPSRAAWKGDGGLPGDKRDARYAAGGAGRGAGAGAEGGRRRREHRGFFARVERPERSGREVSGHGVRGAPPGSRSGASGYGSREGDRVIADRGGAQVRSGLPAPRPGGSRRRLAV